MENLIKKYEYDMQRHERKLKKIDELEKQGQPYDVDDIKLSDDEENKSGDYIERLAEERLKSKKEYDDEYLKAKEDEKANFEKQYESIEKQLEQLKAQMDPEAAPRSEMDQFRDYEKIIDQIDQYGEYVGREQFHEDEAQLQQDELKEFQRLHEKEQSIRDALHAKREGRQKLRRTGGAKSESPVWKDE